MGFDTRDIRTSMDVFTLDNAYLGYVLGVDRGEALPDADQVSSSARQRSQVNGELLGPASTQQLGNSGPARQSSELLYGVSRGPAAPIGRGTIHVGRMFGLLGKRTIPMSDVLTVSLERVVLKQRLKELVSRSGR